jgi:putative FmdB family regulatory protein
MPIREYSAVKSTKSCQHCQRGFELIESIEAPAATECPECGNPVERQISTSSVGGSKTGFDDRAKSAGFQKLEKLGDGEYEKKY